MNKGEYRVTKTYAKEKDPKTDNSFRTLRVPEIVWKELKRRKELIDFQKN